MILIILHNAILLASVRYMLKLISAEVEWSREDWLQEFNHQFYRSFNRPYLFSVLARVILLLPGILSRNKSLALAVMSGRPVAIVCVRAESATARRSIGPSS